MAGKVGEVSDSDFETAVLKSPLPVLLDFWAPWCAPCKAIAPVLDQLANDYAGKITIVKMNTDDNPKTPSQYGVRGIPYLVVFKDGKVVAQLVGAQPKEKIAEAINQALV